MKEIRSKLSTLSDRLIPGRRGQIESQAEQLDNQLKTYPERFRQQKMAANEARRKVEVLTDNANLASRRAKGEIEDIDIMQALLDSEGKTAQKPLAEEQIERDFRALVAQRQVYQARSQFHLAQSEFYQAHEDYHLTMARRLSLTPGNELDAAIHKENAAHIRQKVLLSTNESHSAKKETIQIDEAIVMLDAQNSKLKDSSLKHQDLSIDDLIQNVADPQKAERFARAVRAYETSLKEMQPLLAIIKQKEVQAADDLIQARAATHRARADVAWRAGDTLTYLRDRAESAFIRRDRDEFMRITRLLYRRTEALMQEEFKKAPENSEKRTITAEIRSLQYQNALERFAAIRERSSDLIDIRDIMIEVFHIPGHALQIGDVLFARARDIRDEFRSLSRDVSNQNTQRDVKQAIKALEQSLSKKEDKGFEDIKDALYEVVKLQGTSMLSSSNQERMGIIIKRIEKEVIDLNQQGVEANRTIYQLSSDMYKARAQVYETKVQETTNLQEKDDFRAWGLEYRARAARTWDDLLQVVSNHQRDVLESFNLTLPDRQKIILENNHLQQQATARWFEKGYERNKLPEEPVTWLRYRLIY